MKYSPKRKKKKAIRLIKVNGENEKLVKEGDVTGKAFKDLEGDIKIGDGTVSVRFERVR